MSMNIVKIKVNDNLEQISRTCDVDVRPDERSVRPSIEFQMKGDDAPTLGATDLRPNGETLQILANYEGYSDILFEGTLDYVDDIQESDGFYGQMSFMNAPSARVYRKSHYEVFNEVAVPNQSMRTLFPKTNSHSVLKKLCEKTGLTFGRCDLPNYPMLGVIEFEGMDLLACAERVAASFNFFPFCQFFPRINGNVFEIIRVDYSDHGEGDSYDLTGEIIDQRHRYHAYIPNEIIGDSNVLLTGAERFGVLQYSYPKLDTSLPLGEDPNATQSLIESQEGPIVDYIQAELARTTFPDEIGVDSQEFRFFTVTEKYDSRSQFSEENDSPARVDFKTWSTTERKTVYIVHVKGYNKIPDHWKDAQGNYNPGYDADGREEIESKSLALNDELEAVIDHYGKSEGIELAVKHGIASEVDLEKAQESKERQDELEAIRADMKANEATPEEIEDALEEKRKEWLKEDLVETIEDAEEEDQKSDDPEDTIKWRKVNYPTSYSVVGSKTVWTRSTDYDEFNGAIAKNETFNYYTKDKITKYQDGSFTYREPLLTGSVSENKIRWKGSPWVPASMAKTSLVRGEKGEATYTSHYVGDGQGKYLYQYTTRSFSAESWEPFDTLYDVTTGLRLTEEQLRDEEFMKEHQRKIEKMRDKQKELAKKVTLKNATTHRKEDEEDTTKARIGLKEEEANPSPEECDEEKKKEMVTSERYNSDQYKLFNGKIVGNMMDNPGFRWGLTYQTMNREALKSLWNQDNWFKGGSYSFQSVYERANGLDDASCFKIHDPHMNYVGLGMIWNLCQKEITLEKHKAYWDDISALLTYSENVKAGDKVKVDGQVFIVTNVYHEIDPDSATTVVQGKRLVWGS